MTTESLRRLIDGMTKQQIDRLRQGQLVRLNSGSPLLTVEEIERDYSDSLQTKVQVAWVGEDLGIRRTTFPAICLYPDRGVVR